MQQQYCKAEDMFRLYTESTVANILDKDSTTNLSQDARLIAAIEGANATVGSYIRQNQDLPLAYIPADIRNISAFLAFYDICQSVPNKLTADDDRRYQNYIDHLEKISRNEISLPYVSRSEENAENPVENAVINTAQVNSNKVFGDSMFADYYDRQRNG